MKKFFYLVLLPALAHAQLFNQTVEDKKVGSATSADTAKTLEVAPQVEADAIMLQNYFLSTKDLQADFIQLSDSSRGEIKSTGKMYLAKPGKFHWDYQTPDKQLIVSDGEKVWQYDVDLEQISVRNKSDLVGDVALKILSGEQTIGKMFDVRKADKGSAPAKLHNLIGNETLYRLTPKDSKEATYDAVWIVMGGEVKAILVDSGAGQNVTMFFENVKRNQGISQDKFQFKAPEGVDVIGL